MRGILLVDKPKGWSSYDVIRFLKRKFLLKGKIGHAGTLDPMATGLLIILLGDTTRKFAEFQRIKKEYIATLEFGKETDTFDAEGKIVREYGGEIKIIRDEVEKILAKFHGEIMQTPPAHSALKMGGQPAYKLARRGESPEMALRKVFVYEAKVLNVSGKNAEILFSVSSGTYIRSLARDIGRELGYGAYLSVLRRTKIGDFSVEQAKLPENILESDVIAQRGLIRI